jgi:hypothetical protein
VIGWNIVSSAPCCDVDPRSLVGCTRMLATDEYVPYVLDALESHSVFDDPIEVAASALASQSLPPS